MNLKFETQAQKLDTINLISAGFIFLAGVAGFYYFSEALTLIRVLIVLVAAGAAIATVLTTELGGNLLEFVQESRTELRKVVWPTRSETLQTTLAVVAMVIVIGIFMWLLDGLLFWIVRLLVG